MDKERPWRRYDQDKETNELYRRVPVVEKVAGQGSENEKTYRLDIELGRLEFLIHPGMAREDLLVSGATDGLKLTFPHLDIHTVTILY